jgi:hypothetical protein
MWMDKLLCVVVGWNKTVAAMSRTCEPHFVHNVSLKFCCDVSRGILVTRRGTKPMQILIAIVAIWFGLNLAIFAFILWQRSPHFRHRVSRLTLGVFAPKETSAHHRHWTV